MFWNSVSEVGLLTEKWLEGDLLVLPQEDVVSTERPTRDGEKLVNMLQIIFQMTFSERYNTFFLNTPLGCVPLRAFQMSETDSEDTELIFGLQRVPGGEFERHFSHWLNVFVKLGQQRGLRELLELWRFTDGKKGNKRGMLLKRKQYQDGRERSCRIMFLNEVKTYWLMVATASSPSPWSLTVMNPKRTSSFQIITSTR